MNVLLAGDLAQLPPVGDLARYSTGGKCSRQQAAGRLLYEQFTESYILTDSMRQAGSQNSEFRDQLNRLSNGTFTKEDWLAWRKRSLSKLDPATQKLFEESGLQQEHVIVVKEYCCPVHLPSPKVFEHVWI